VKRGKRRPEEGGKEKERAVLNLRQLSTNKKLPPGWKLKGKPPLTRVSQPTREEREKKGGSFEKMGGSEGGFVTGRRIKKEMAGLLLSEKKVKGSVGEKKILRSGSKSRPTLSGSLEGHLLNVEHCRRGGGKKKRGPRKEK